MIRHLNFFTSYDLTVNCFFNSLHLDQALDPSPRHSDEAVYYRPKAQYQDKN